jgi:hypothetical protein
MAKRKAVRGSKRKAAKGRSSRRTRATAKKTAASRRIARRAVRKVARKAKASASARAKGKGVVRRAKPAARTRFVAKKRAAKKQASKARKTAPAKARSASKNSSAAPAKRTAPKAAAVRPVARTAPGLNRARRTISDDEIVPSPPSSLDLDRTASAARSGRRELLEKYEEHTETSPALTGGDIDADWESAYSVGDEAPGGDNPTPDQDIVDDIGRAVGVEYQDNEELKGERKIADRDKHRWELDPASSDDWEDR